MQRPTSILLILCAALAALAFMLPWIQYDAPFHAERAKLYADTKPIILWNDFVLISPSQGVAIQNNPTEGLNALSIFQDLRERSKTSDASRFFVGSLTGMNNVPERALLFAGYTVLLILSALLALLVPHRRLLEIFGVLLFLLYLALRYRIAMTEGGRLGTGLNLGIGFWVAIYVNLLLSAALFLRRFTRF